ncbi:MAG: hypothetical protein IK125_06065 [Lachnospiraceae bacterium]|nr:hypothetical protein [Lachnospiraceae bacterium]
MRFGTKWRKVHRLKREAVQLGIVVLVLGLIYLFIFLSDDRKAPVIAFSDDPVSYVPGGSTEGLLAGVTATDNRDGDITKKVIVLPSTEVISDTEVRVQYQVRDSRGNLTTATRVCNLTKESASNTDPGKTTPDPTQSVPEETTAQPKTTEEVVTTSPVKETEEPTSAPEPTTQEPTTEEPTTETPTQEPATAEPATEEPTTETPTQEPTTAEPTTEEPTTEAPAAIGPNGEKITAIEAVFIGQQKYIGEISGPADIMVQGVLEDGNRLILTGWESDDVGAAYVAGKNVFNIRYQGLKCKLEVEAIERPAPINNGIPVITLKQTEVTVKKGSYFHYRNLIDQLYDDKDSHDVLVQRIRVEGWDKFSTKKVGTYVLKVSVKDTDKHNSAVTVLTVHVVN